MTAPRPDAAPPALTPRERLLQAIGTYGANAASTGELAPAQELLDAVDAACRAPATDAPRPAESSAQPNEEAASHWATARGYDLKAPHWDDLTPAVRIAIGRVVHNLRYALTSPAAPAPVTDAEVEAFWADAPAVSADELMDAFQNAHDRAINRQLGTTEATRQGVIAAVACFNRSLSAGRRRFVDANESFEHAAEAFQRATGLLAPGKDLALGTGGGAQMRETAWAAWCAAIEYERAASRPSAEAAPTAETTEDANG